MIGPLISELPSAAIFEGLSQEELKLVLREVSIQKMPTGAFIFRQGEPAKQMFLLGSGRARLAQTTADGHEFLCRFVRPGQIFGDKGAIPDEHYDATTTADRSAQTYSWKTDVVLELQKGIPRFAENLLAITAAYLSCARERFNLLATAPAEQRIHWALTDLATHFGLPQGGGIELTGRTLQQDIADLAVTTVFTVNRALNDYARRGLLTKRRGHILLRQNSLGQLALAQVPRTISRVSCSL